MAPMFSTLSIFFFNILIFTPVLAQMVFEDGYSVSTIIDGNKVKINPNTIIPVPGSVIILDSTASTFYTVSYNKDSEFSISKLAGTETAGYVDGSLDKAKFNKPKSFAVDSTGNIYVADVRNKHAIRKISKSGVTTIAGGYSQKPGRADGPALNASFSDDFELSFVPDRCTLMISDRGSRLIREIQLKAEDCSRESHSALGSVSTWFLTVGLPCLVCLILGLVIRPFIIPTEGRSRLHRNMTWKHFLISLERQVLMFCFAIRSVVVDSNIYSFLRKLLLLIFSHLCLMFRPKVVLRCQTSRIQLAPLINFDGNENEESSEQQVVAHMLEDLMNFEGSFDNSELTTTQDDDLGKQSDVSVGCYGNVDSMILANIKGFAEQENASSGEVSQSILSLANQKKKVT